MPGKSNIKRQHQSAFADRRIKIASDSDYSDSRGVSITFETFRVDKIRLMASTPIKLSFGLGNVFEMCGGKLSLSNRKEGRKWRENTNQKAPDGFS